MTDIIPKINFSDLNTEEFLLKALEIFRYQAVNNPVYYEYISLLGIDISKVNSLEEIPFLPISFYKSHQIISGNKKPKITFFSSGTTDVVQSKHHLTDVSIYKESFRHGFQYFFDDIREFTLLALLPSYLEQENSSLVYMVDELIKQTKNKDSGFYLNNHAELIEKLEKLDKEGKNVLLIGVSYALLDLIEKQQFQLKNTIVMETGGMKGRRKEMIKRELHDVLKKGFGVPKIYSEYGMTELLSQAYSLGNERFKTPPWMKILIREVEDPLTILPYEKSGGINVIDLANVNSCSFIATQDLGKVYIDETFEVLGRFDHSDIRGCNLMI